MVQYNRGNIQEEPVDLCLRCLMIDAIAANKELAKQVVLGDVVPSWEIEPAGATGKCGVSCDCTGVPEEHPREPGGKYQTEHARQEADYFGKASLKNQAEAKKCLEGFTSRPMEDIYKERFESLKDLVWKLAELVSENLSMSGHPNKTPLEVLWSMASSETVSLLAKKPPENATEETGDAWAAGDPLAEEIAEAADESDGESEDT